MAKKVLQAEKQTNKNTKKNSSQSVHYYKPMGVWSELWSQTLIALSN